jgi:DNA-binding FadR family transcriptional regulator
MMLDLDPPWRKMAQSRSAHDLVASTIGRGIIEGDFPTGSILPGDGDLMERFGVSRTALREAMKTLAAKGLIESKTRVGTRVLDETRWNWFDPDILAWRLQTGVDIAFLSRLFEIRLALEPLAAAAAACFRSEADLVAIRTAWERMSRLPTTREDFTAADLAFHRGILDASANPFLHSIGSVIEAALAISFMISSPADDDERVLHSSRQHRAIYDAIANRDAQAASAAMTAVVLQGVESSGIHGEDTDVTVALTLFAR